MNATLKQVRAYIAVAKTGSFAEASELIHLSQPALSLAIKKLEECVGGKLFFRTTRQLMLTPEGEYFLPIAKRLLAEWDDAFTDLNNLFSLSRGQLIIAAMPSFASCELPKLTRSARFGPTRASGRPCVAFKASRVNDASTSTSKSEALDCQKVGHRPEYASGRVPN